MTNLGDSEFGPATGKAVRVLTVADCACFESHGVQTWFMLFLQVFYSFV